MTSAQIESVGRQEEALRVAEDLLTDIELKRLKASEIALKASRVARLVGHEGLIEFLGYERNGYPTDGSATTSVTTATGATSLAPKTAGAARCGALAPRRPGGPPLESARNPWTGST